MRVFTPDGTELMVIETVEPFENGIAIGGTIMGAMPLKGVIRPAELRRGMRFMSLKLIWAGIAMFFRR